MSTEVLKQFQQTDTYKYIPKKLYSQTVFNSKIIQICM